MQAKLASGALAEKAAEFGAEVFRLAEVCKEVQTSSSWLVGVASCRDAGSPTGVDVSP